MAERGQVWEASTGSRFYVVGPAPEDWGYDPPRMTVIEVEGKDPGQEHHLTEAVIESMTPVGGPRRPDDAEAFAILADYAYGSPDAVWTSPRVLVQTALAKARGRVARTFDFTEVDFTAPTEEESDGPDPA